MAARQPRWLGLLFTALALLALVMIACGGSGSAEPDATPTITPTATGAGFLPTWTPGATFTEVPTETPLPPGAKSGPVGSCPPYPAIICARPGDRINLYEELPMARIAALSVSQGNDVQWVTEGERLRRLARMFDRGVLLEPYVIAPDPEGERYSLALRWEHGEGLALPAGSTLDVVPLTFDTGTRVIGSQATGIQTALEPEFVELLFASFSSVTPTPQPPAPTRTPTPGLIPDGTLHFGHPAGELRWQGPDTRVYSMLGGHCAVTDESFGVPRFIELEDELGFWGSRQVPRQSGWHWTGYFHGDWQIWQGDDPLVIYLVNVNEEKIAWEYRSFPCA
jgi:hypothetical protein